MVSNSGQACVPTGTDYPRSWRTDANNIAAQIKCAENVKKFSSRRKHLGNTKFTVFQIVWGQCSVSLQNKLMMDKGFETELENSHCNWMLKQIRSVTYSLSDDKYIFHASVENKEMSHWGSTSKHSSSYVKPSNMAAGMSWSSMLIWRSTSQSHMICIWYRHEKSLSFLNPLSRLRMKT